MNKLFERIFWHNNTTPAINETNLNLMSKAIDEIDDRVVEMGAYAPIAEQARDEAVEASTSAKKDAESAKRDADRAMSATPEGYETLTQVVNSGVSQGYMRKNLYKPTLETAEINGVTITANGDGTYTLNGTATSNGIIRLGGEIDISNGVTYRLSGGVDEDYSVLPSKPSVKLYYSVEFEDGSTLTYEDKGKGVVTANNIVSISAPYIRIYNNTKYDNITIKPMVVNHDLYPSAVDYTPYAPSNVELSEKIDNIKVDGGSNPNLIDNGWFTVNQRDVTRWSNGYGVDRWKNILGYNQITSDGCIYEGGSDCILDQYLPLTNGTYTLSVKMADDTIHSVVFELADSEINYTPIGTSGLQAWIAPTGLRTWNGGSSAGNITIKAIKLERGTISTLANDNAPNYADELLRCKTSKADTNDTYANGNLKCSIIKTYPDCVASNVGTIIISDTLIQQGARPANIVTNNGNCWARMYDINATSGAMSIGIATYAQMYTSGTFNITVEWLI